jgi:glutathione S-transferase
MKLHWSPRSPFVRKVMIAAHELGLAEQLTLVRNVAAMNTKNPEIMADNPLGKIPTLVLDKGDVIIDSAIIVEFLDFQAGGGILLPGLGIDRFRVLSRQSLADGLMDLLTLWRNEAAKPSERQSKDWLDAFSGKVSATLDRFETLAHEYEQQAFGAAHIALGTALSYIDFRFSSLDWREGRPTLARWHATFAARPSVIATEVSDGW